MEKRARNACWRCKERRVKCTSEKPTCANCARSKHPCKYGLKLLWRDEALARGICFGRQGVYGRSSKTSVSSHSPALNSFKGQFYFFHTFTDDFDGRRRPFGGEWEADATVDKSPSLVLEEEHQNDGEDEVKAAAYEAAIHDLTLYSTIISDSPSASANGDPFELHLFDFYINNLIPNLSNSPTENPYLEFIAPLSLSSKTLYHSVLSWSAHELSFRNPGEHRYRQISVKHKVRALRGLREEIESSQGNDLSASNNLASILATMITLSCLEIVETCSSTWMAHLKAARMLCSFLWPKGHLATDNFGRFCIMWFVSHDIMSRTAWIGETLFEPREWFAGDDESEIDVVMGCSRGLIHQVSEISTLIMDKRKQEDTSALERSLFTVRRDGIEAALQRLGQRISTTKASAPPELLKVAESKRLCALIYLYTCIDNATPSSPTVQAMTARVMRLLTELPPKPSITFPLFVVGTMGVWNEDDRRLVLDKFTEMIQARPLANIMRAKEVVKAVWLDRDVGKRGRWEDLVERRGRLLSLA
ncbi:hypothetical protein G7046_g5033 [Stylonectria norvegica]|nr:hypothetical protein G7046_g5033 [Stylonectria norvegica]